MLRLKNVSVHHTEEQELLTMTAVFRGAGDVNFMLSPDETLMRAWAHLERLLRVAVLDSMKQDIEETEGCNCGISVGSPPWFHMDDCPLYRAPR